MTTRIVGSKSGMENWILFIKDGSEESVIKLYRDHSRLENEIEALSILQLHGLKYPRVYETGQRNYTSYARYEKLSLYSNNHNSCDIAWMVPLLTPIYRIYGDAYGRVNQVLSGYGEQSWLDYLKGRIKLYVSVIEKYDALETVKYAIEMLNYCLTGPFMTNPHLIHNDLKPDNVVWLNTYQVAMLIDWEAAAFGDPLLDIGKYWWRSAATEVTPFLDLYKKVVVKPVSDDIAAFRLKYYRALSALGYYMSGLDNKPRRQRNRYICEMALNELATTDWLSLRKECESIR